MNVTSLASQAVSSTNSLLGPALNQVSDTFSNAIQVSAKQAIEKKLKIYDISFTPEQMQRARDKSLNSFKKAFDELTVKAGIDTNQPIEFEIKWTGHLYVKGNHPDKEKIERFLDNNPDIEKSCLAALRYQDWLNSAEKLRLFQEAYRKNPEEAIAAFTYVLNSKTENLYNLVVRNKDGALEYNYVLRNQELKN